MMIVLTDREVPSAGPIDPAQVPLDGSDGPSQDLPMTITCTIDDDGIAVVTMHNPPVNAITVADTWAIRDVFEELGRDRDARVVILTAEGKGFNAGIDIKEMQSADGFDHLLGSGAACLRHVRADLPHAAAR